MVLLFGASVLARFRSAVLRALGRDGVVKVSEAGFEWLFLLCSSDGWLSW